MGGKKARIGVPLKIRGRSYRGTVPIRDIVLCILENRLRTPAKSVITPTGPNHNQ